MTPKKTVSQKKTNETSRILEHVESLLALHQNQGNEDAGTQSKAGSVSQLEIDELLSSQSRELVKAFESNCDERHAKTVEIIRAISTLIERRFESLDGKFAELLSAIQSNPTQDTIGPAELKTPPPADTDAGPDWQQQKAEMLAKYGIETDSQPADDPSPITSPLDNSEFDPAIKKLEGLHESANTISAKDAKEIETLKSELNAKLLEAEVEISIHRAKICQQTAEMEKRQVDLDRREASLDRLSADQNPKKRKSGILDRFSRHVSPRKES